MFKDILRTAVMLSVLLLATIAFFGFVALILELGRVLPPYIGGFMAVLVIIAVILLIIAILLRIVKDRS